MSIESEIDVLTSRIAKIDTEIACYKKQVREDRMVRIIKIMNGSPKKDIRLKIIYAELSASRMSHIVNINKIDDLLEEAEAILL